MKYRIMDTEVESYVCEKHGETFGPSGCRFTECPGCVRDERDRLREDIKNLSFDLSVERSLFRGVSDVAKGDPTQCIYELRKERDRYRKALEEITEHNWFGPQYDIAKKALEGT